MLTITTCHTYPQPPQNLLPLADILNHQSVPIHFDIWQNRLSDPFLLPLCVWDYTAESQTFRRWLDDVEKSGQQFVNPPPLIRWNISKKYLCDLATWGADVISGVFAPSENQAAQNTLRERGWQETVIEPTVGQSGCIVARITAASPPSDWPAYPQGVIAQPHIREIEQVGEISLIFLNSTLSHAVLHRPLQGERRVNSAYSVEIRPAALSETVVRTVRSVLDLLSQMPVCTRADGTVTSGRLLLNGLELIESVFYLHTVQDAVERFVVVLVSLLLSVPSQE